MDCNKCQLSGKKHIPGLPERCLTFAPSIIIAGLSSESRVPIPVRVPHITTPLCTMLSNYKRVNYQRFRFCIKKKIVVKWPSTYRSDAHEPVLAHEATRRDSDPYAETDDGQAENCKGDCDCEECCCKACGFDCTPRLHGVCHGGGWVDTEMSEMSV